MARRDACWRRNDRVEFHVRGCRPGRPCCRYRRARLAAKRAGEVARKEIPPCDCPAYAFPHRAQSGVCGDRDAFAAKVYGPSVMKSAPPPVTYAEAAAE
jgi:hypothetical protein